MICARPVLDSEPINQGLPAARNLPFQLAAVGSQTSIPMRESLLGAETASTRQ
jgi:hypothetical protein